MRNAWAQICNPDVITALCAYREKSMSNPMRVTASLIHVIQSVNFCLRFPPFAVKPSE